MMEHGRRDLILVLLCLLAGVLLFTNLGNVYLWQDEAETAVLARNTLKFGIPQAYDGKNLVRNIYEDPCVNKGWKYAAWLQFYLVAGIFWLFGESTFTARLVFVLFGLGCVPMCFLLANRLFKNRFVSRVSVALMVFFVPFLLYVRQCRWYALTIFFTLWLVLSYLDLLRNRKIAPAFGFIISAACLFHSNYGIFFPVLSAIFVHYILFHRNVLKLRIISIILFAVFILTAPSLLYLGSFEYSGQFSLERTEDHLEFYVRVLNKYIFPLLFVFISLVYFRIRRRFPVLEDPLDKSSLWLPIIVIISTIFFLLLADERQLRYIIHLVPLCFMLMALVLAGWQKQSSLLAFSLFILVGFTNIFHTGAPFAKQTKLHLYDYLWEVNHDYDGPAEGIVEYLKKEADPADTVKMNYGDFAAIFYTDLKVDNGPFMAETYPEWIVYRRDWQPQEFIGSRYQKRIESLYEKIHLPVPDIRFENRPDPGYHKFKTVANWPHKVIIYRRK